LEVRSVLRGHPQPTSADCLDQTPLSSGQPFVVDVQYPQLVDLLQLAVDRVTRRRAGIRKPVEVQSASAPAAENPFRLPRAVCAGAKRVVGEPDEDIGGVE